MPELIEWKVWKVITWGLKPLLEYAAVNMLAGTNAKSLRRFWKYATRPV